VIVFALLGLAVFLSSAALDYAHARYAAARDAGRRCGAAGWSVAQWMAATVGFAVAVKVSFWLLPCEAAGLAAGTWLAVRRSTRPVRS
jgi:hypothetical protein